MIKERPILFNGEMVRAILEDLKTQTRRIIKPQPDEDGICFDNKRGGYYDTSGRLYKNPHGKPGDRLWVRETHFINYNNHNAEVYYRADARKYISGTGLYTDSKAVKWRPSIFMPRWASRIMLEVKSVRAERLGDMTQVDAKAEGVTSNEERFGFKDQSFVHTHKWQFINLWESINGTGSWDTKQLVWVDEFFRVKS